MSAALNYRDRKIYIPQMSYVAARTMSAAFQAFGFEAEPSPDADQAALGLAGKYTSGDECYPEMVTLGSFLKVTEQPDFRPERTIFLLPTSGGPCRFGQYRALLKKILTDLHLESIAIISPTSSNGYEGFGEYGQALMRVGWWAIVIADILRKLLLKTRPYEQEAGTTNAVFATALEDICRTLAAPLDSQSKKLQRLRQDLVQIRDRFRRIPAHYLKEQKPLVGLVGEIFCRLNDFSNAFLIERIEAQGGETWISDISEWVWYTNDEQRRRIIRKGKRVSKEMLFTWIKFVVQKYDEHVLWAPFKTDFYGYEEISHIRGIMRRSEPYLPQNGALGEMVSSVGKTIYLYEKGAAGVIDISPFSCMNGIVCEAVFPKVSQDHDNFPIRTFYFDGTQTTVEQDLEIFMELIRSYQQRKVRPRKYPAYFH